MKILDFGLDLSQELVPATMAENSDSGICNEDGDCGCIHNHVAGCSCDKQEEP